MVMIFPLSAYARYASTVRDSIEVRKRRGTDGEHEAFVGPAGGHVDEAESGPRPKA